MSDKAHVTSGLDLFPLLKGVSRSFYLTLRILPRAIRGQVGLAYLLARISDTIADTDWIPVDQRIESLKNFILHLQGPRAVPFIPPLDSHSKSSLEEKRILDRSMDCLEALYRLDPADRILVNQVLTTITHGQISDLEAFPLHDGAKVSYLQSDRDLDSYTYQVAGCVGEFWTRMCELHLKLPSYWDSAGMVEKGINFGKGLQYVNILRDFKKDRELGRSYLPEEHRALIEAVLRSPKDHPSEAEAEFESVFLGYLDRAERYLRDGWTYTRQLPWKWIRVRLACSWPILIGMQTLEAMRKDRPYHSESPVKITRKEVKRILLKTILLYPIRGRWEKLIKT